MEDFDIESTIIQTGRKEDSARKVALRDDRSTMSIQTSGTAMSRRSGVSMIDINSLVSGAPSSLGGMKKLPGESGLRANAERRLEKAQMAKIENHLRKLRETEDLSYSERGYSESQTEDGKRAIIDDTTLA